MYNIPGLAIHHLKMLAVRNCQILPSLRQICGSLCNLCNSVIPGVQTQLLFDFSVLCGSIGTEEDSLHAACFSCPKRCQAGQMQVVLAGLCQLEEEYTTCRCFSPPWEVQVNPDSYSSHGKSAWWEESVSVVVRLLFSGVGTRSS